MPVIDHEAIAMVTPAAGIRTRRLLDRANGGVSVSLGDLILEAGSPPRPRHWHEVEEVILIREGQGHVHLGDDTIPVATGAVIHIPAHILHGLENTGSQDLVAQFFYPATDVVRHEVDA